jgi:hypothetical protein
MRPEITTSWQCPPFSVSGEERMGWIEEQLEEGEGWLSQQRSYKNLARNLRIFDGLLEDKTKSVLVSNGLKYDLRKFIEVISDVREIGTYSTDAKQLRPYADVFNKVTKAVYDESGFPRQNRKALQYACVMGRGYIWPKVHALDYGYGERMIEFEPLGLLDVVPVQVPSSNCIQEAYAVTVYTYVPIAEAHARFPLFQSSLLPVSGVSYNSRVQARRVDFAERFRYGEQLRHWGNLYCEIRYTWIRDLRINTLGVEIPMGDLGTSWFYKVPYVGQDIFGGIRGGMPYMRKAMAEDCRIYPQLRLIISSRGMKTPMYDGPAFDWHAKIPLIQYDVDDWVWEPVGRSLVEDVGSIEITKRKIERKMDDVIRVSLNPPLGYDRSSTGGPKIENFDIFEENVRAGLDGKPRDIMQSLLPEEVRVSSEHFQYLQMLTQMREQQLGISDLGNLANLKFQVTSENFDKAIESIGPIAKGIAAAMEASNAKVAQLLPWLIAQWYGTKRVMEYIGPGSLTPDIFDYDPQSLVPSHMPEEHMNGSFPSWPSHYSTQQRVKRLLKNLRLVNVPSTLLKITQQAEQLKYLQLKKMGAPISWNTVLEKVGVDNPGELEGSNEFEKWINEEMQMLKIKAQAAQMAQAMGLGQPQGPGQGKGGGRPATGKKPPQLAQKGGAGGEARVVMKES